MRNNSYWPQVAVAVIASIGGLGAVFYVAFQGNANYQAIQRLEIATAQNLENIRALKIELAQQQQALGEIETQFCSQDAVRNLMHAHDLRNMAMVWEKAFGSSMPIGDAYYPTLCNRAHTGALAPTRP